MVFTLLGVSAVQERILQRYSNLEETVSPKRALDEAMALAIDAYRGYKTDMKDASHCDFHDLSTSACVILIWGYVGYYAGFMM